MKARKVLYPGSFDPITNGHIHIIKRCAKIFDEVNVAVTKNIKKNNAFSLDERVEMVEKSCQDIGNIKIHKCEILTVEFAKKIGCDVIVRGLRAVSDYESEMQMALANKSIDHAIETIFLVSDAKYSFLSSSTVRELAQYKADISDLVPDFVNKKIMDKYTNLKG